MKKKVTCLFLPYCSYFSGAISLSVLIPFSTDPCCSDADRAVAFSPLLSSSLRIICLSPPSPSSPFASIPFRSCQWCPGGDGKPISLCELLSLMRLLSHIPYQINRLHQPITTQTHQPGPRQAQRLTSSHRRSHFVIDKMWCKQRQKGWRQRER